MSYSFQIVTASALERRMVLQKHWKRLEKEAKKDLQPRKNTRKMKKRQIEQKNKASDNATSSATDTIGKPEPETVKPETEKPETGNWPRGSCSSGAVRDRRDGFTAASSW